MSDNETTEMWKEHRAEVQMRHATWNARNMQIMKVSGLKWEAKNPECLVMQPRPKGFAVNFYPSTGRWTLNNKVAGSGGALKFIAWWMKNAPAEEK